MPQTADAAPLLKDLLNRRALALIGRAAAQAQPGFDTRAYLAMAGDGLEALSIMQRMARAADSLHAHLPASYPRALQVVRRMAPQLPGGFVAMVLPEFVGRHGQDHLDLSLEALRELTPYSTSEFGLRPFLERAPEAVLAQATRWAADANEHVRRLASEGTRARLPWGRRLPFLSATPQLTLPILAQLQADPSDYVRRSVANHLNDLARDQPAWVLDLLETWPTEQAETRWITKHAVRNLVKAGEPRALQLVGAKHGAEVALASFAVHPATLKLGQTLQLSAELRSTARAPQRLVIDYAIHYVKKNGDTARKVFKWRTLTLGAGEALALDKTQTIADFTTRKHYAGRHAVELLVNGVPLAQGEFALKLAGADSKALR